MKKLFHAIILSLVLIPSAFADTESDHYWWTGVALGTDPAQGSYNGAAITGGWFPTPKPFSWGNFNWGVQGYLEGGHYDYKEGSGNAVSLGVEPVITWNGAYAGLGLALGNTTPNLGTVWNFSSVLGYRYDITERWSADVFFRHRSHARSLGIETDKENTGVNFLGLQAVYRF